jgi:hypothetical protein
MKVYNLAEMELAYIQRQNKQTSWAEQGHTQDLL